MSLSAVAAPTGVQVGADRSQQIQLTVFLLESTLSVFQYARICLFPNVIKPGRSLV